MNERERLFFSFLNMDYISIAPQNVHHSLQIISFLNFVRISKLNL
jgi:hypothetical protein